MKRKDLKFAVLVVFLLVCVSTLQAQKRTRAAKRTVPSTEATESSVPSNEGTEVVGKRITFADGRTLIVDEAWRTGDVVWFRRGGVTQSWDQPVKAIDSVFAPANIPVKQTKAAPVPAADSVSTWIYLVGGARVKADAVKETTDGAWYTRSNLSVFLARDRIERIARDEPDVIANPGRSTGWTSGSAFIDQLIRTNGNRFAVDPYLVFLVIEQESHFRTRAVSPKGARGLMQLMPGTARRFAVKKPFDPVENIRGGTQYLKQLLEMFNDRVDLALASYNAGEGRVIQYGHKVPPFRETQEYVKRISRRYGKTERKGTDKPSGKGSGE